MFSLFALAWPTADAASGDDAGTDATIAEHISTIVKREYVMKQRVGAIEYLVPSTLGIGLVDGYNTIGLENSLSKPKLRRLVRSPPLSSFSPLRRTTF